MKIISAEIVDGNRLPTGVEISHPTPSVYAVIDGKIYINGEELNSGFYCVIDKNDMIAFGNDKGKVLRVAIDSVENSGLSFGEFNEVADSRLLYLFVHMLGDGAVLALGDGTAGKGLAGYLVSALVAHSEHDTCGNKYVDMAKRYIDANYFLDIKVEEISEKIGIDRKYLRNLFTEYLGVSTKDYIMNLRIERAKELLANSAVSVNSVALSVGYADALGFSKMFKKYTGLSPSDFRSSGLKTLQKEPEREAPVRAKEDIKYFLL